MNDEHDYDLRTIFARQRRDEAEGAPAWRPECLHSSATPARVTVRWMPVALATACVIALSVFVAGEWTTAPQLSELPPLFESPPADLFPHLEPPLLAFEAPSDFLLPDHLSLSIP